MAQTLQRITQEARDEMVAICERYILQLPDVVVPEPYIPFVPAKWNGTIVIAEAQNLSRTYQLYVDDLLLCSPEQRIHRLLPDSTGRVGVLPWDDHTLKLAVEAADGIAAVHTAVSNAVPWSLRKDGEANANPTKELRDISTSFWSDILRVLHPDQVIAAGATAREVMNSASRQALTRDCIAWPSPSQRVLSPLSKPLNVDDLHMRFPEVAHVVNEHPEWVTGSFRENRILYACLATNAMANYKFGCRSCRSDS